GHLPLPDTAEAVAQDAQPAPRPQTPHIRDQLIVRRSQILGPQIRHEGFHVNSVETETISHLILHLRLADRPDTARLPDRSQPLVHSTRRQPEPLFPASNPPRLGA